MENLSQDLVQGSLNDLHAQHDGFKTRLQEQLTYRPLPCASTDSSPVSTQRVNNIKRKKKARRAYPPADETAADIAETDFREPLQLPQTILTDKNTVETFFKLFDKSQSRGPVDWDDFESSMKWLNFSMLPRKGSVFAFYPPDSMIQVPLTKRPPSSIPD